MRKVNRIKLYLGVSNMLMISGIVAKTMSLFREQEDEWPTQRESLTPFGKI